MKPNNILVKRENIASCDEYSFVHMFSFILSSAAVLIVSRHTLLSDSLAKLGSRALDLLMDIMVLADLVFMYRDCIYFDALSLIKAHLRFGYVEPPRYQIDET
jgi:hypothetical protein